MKADPRALTPVSTASSAKGLNVMPARSTPDAHQTIRQKDTRPASAGKEPHDACRMSSRAARTTHVGDPRGAWASEDAPEKQGGGRMRRPRVGQPRGR